MDIEQEIRDAIDRGVLRHIPKVHSSVLIEMADKATAEVVALLRAKGLIP